MVGLNAREGSTYRSRLLFPLKVFSSEVLKDHPLRATRWNTAPPPTSQSLSTVPQRRMRGEVGQKPTAGSLGPGAEGRAAVPPGPPLDLPAPAHAASPHPLQKPYSAQPSNALPLPWRPLRTAASPRPPLSMAAVMAPQLLRPRLQSTPRVRGSSRLPTTHPNHPQRLLRLLTGQAADQPRASSRHQSSRMDPDQPTQVPLRFGSVLARLLHCATGPLRPRALS